MKNMFRAVFVLGVLVMEGAWAQAYGEPRVKVVGIGGDGLSYEAEAPTGFEYAFRLGVEDYYSYSNKTFVRFQERGRSWPSSGWGVDRSNFAVYSVVMYACELSGVGGDGRTYTEQWTSDGYFSGRTDVFRPREYYEINGIPFVHFSLNGLPWPSRDWGVDASSWVLVCY